MTSQQIMAMHRDMFRVTCAEETLNIFADEIRPRLSIKAAELELDEIDDLLLAIREKLNASMNALNAEMARIEEMV